MSAMWPEGFIGHEWKVDQCQLSGSVLSVVIRLVIYGGSVRGQACDPLE
jgi:hypothetical protein